MSPFIARTPRAQISFKLIYSAHPVVLVGSDSRELGLREGEGLEVLRRLVVQPARIDVNDVEAGLVAVHRVQYHLK